MRQSTRRISAVSGGEWPPALSTESLSDIVAYVEDSTQWRETKNTKSISMSPQK